VLPKFMDRGYDPLGITAVLPDGPLPAKRTILGKPWTRGDALIACCLGPMSGGQPWACSTRFTNG